MPRAGCCARCRSGARTPRCRRPLSPAHAARAAKRAIDAQAGREAQACFAQARTIVEGARHGLEFPAARIDRLEAEQRLRNGRCAAAKSSLAAASAALLELGGEVSGWPMVEIAGIEGAAGFKPAATRQLPRPSHGPSACTHPRRARTRPPCCERASMRPGINASGTAPWLLRRGCAGFTPIWNGCSEPVARRN